jgi:EAL domain-containing protein (putative c-di-GMP-specific phosphodiesterase class I)
MTESLLRITLRKGQRIFSQGDAADCAYIIERGRVAVLVAGGGRETKIAERGPGDLFGEMAIIDSMPRTASVQALEECVLLQLTKLQIARRVEAADPVVRLILDVLLARFRDTISGIGSDAAPAAAPSVLVRPNAPAPNERNRIEALAQVRLERELEVGIRDSAFELHFQPIVHLRDGRTAGFEALIRWRHGDRGLVPPAVFIPAAEASGLIVPLSEWCLKQACASLAAFRQAVAPDHPLFMSVNISGADLQRPDFFDRFRRIVGEAGAAPEDIKLEITEGVLMKDPEQAAETLKACRALGGTIALDDFGTGYSSMSYLSRFPIDTLKIDRSFVQALHTDRASHSIVNAIVALGWGLDIPTVAEGIESADDADALLAIGCAYGQGYHFSKPVPERDAIAYLRAGRHSAQHRSKVRRQLPR